MNQQDKEELLDPRVPCVVIRHLSGTKALSAEEIPIGTFKEITVGRDLSCDIRYDNDRDDLVSRQHLKIAFGNGQAGTPEFTITDMESRNGTFVNLQRVTGSMKVQPGDIVQVGAGGPEFLFDFFPRARAATPVDSGGARGAPVSPAAAPTGTEKVKRGSRAGLVLALALFVLIGAAAVVWRLRFPDKSPEIALDRGQAVLAELQGWLKTEAGNGKALAARARLLFHRDPFEPRADARGNRRVQYRRDSQHRGRMDPHRTNEQAPAQAGLHSERRRSERRERRTARSGRRTPITGVHSDGKPAGAYAHLN